MRHLLPTICILWPYGVLAEDLLQIDEAGFPHVVVTETGVGVFQEITGQPYLTLLDKDDDGVFDLLTYSVLDTEGNTLFDVEDYGMDGQADFRIDFVNETAEVFYRGKWREGVGKKQDRYVVIEGVKVPLKQVLHELGRDDF